MWIVDIKRVGQKVIDTFRIIKITVNHFYIIYPPTEISNNGTIEHFL